MELQLVESARRRGIGRYLMSLLEAIGRREGTRKAMLTVFKSNSQALAFYSRLGYKPDGISPSRCLPPAEAEEYSYEIMSKVL
ncbi:hypothetical protein HK405_005270 [Cladochytrium tenue]|nr:hypothetical protein HK405_005270 [Cladochytrium tenue]